MHIIRWVRGILQIVLSLAVNIYYTISLLHCDVSVTGRPLVHILIHVIIYCNIMHVVLSLTPSPRSVSSTTVNNDIRVFGINTINFFWFWPEMGTHYYFNSFLPTILIVAEYSSIHFRCAYFLNRFWSFIEILVFLKFLLQKSVFLCLHV